MAVPAAVPYTMPEPSTLAVAALLVLHVPPPVVSVSIAVVPVHTVAGPLMALTVGVALTVCASVAVVVQPKLLVII